MEERTTKGKEMGQQRRDRAAKQKRERDQDTRFREIWELMRNRTTRRRHAGLQREDRKSYKIERHTATRGSGAEQP